MESNPIHLPYAQRLQNKLDFLEKTKTFDLDQHQKESIQNQLDVFIKLAQNIKDMDSQNPLVDSFYKHLYKQCKKFERQVLFWLRLKICDPDAFKFVTKEKGKQYLSIMDEIPAPVKIDGITIEKLNDLNFPCLVYTNQELCSFAEMIFKEQNLLEDLNISSEKLNKIILTICAGYNVLPYHNFSHGFNVFQMFYTLVKRTELQTILDVSEKFLIFLAALGHDLNHRGYNNLGESKIRSKASLIYYDKSILENMHTSKLLQILKSPEINLIEHFPNPARAEFKEMIVSVILATDMANHHKRLVKLIENVTATVAYRKATANNEEVPSEIEEKRIKLENPTHRKRIIKNVVHACDIGNPAQDYDLYIYWSSLVTQEFDHQTKVEYKRGAEVTTYMKYQNLPSFYETQISFAKTLAFPLWEQIGILFEGAREGVETMKVNIKKLEEDKTKAQAKTQTKT